MESNLSPATLSGRTGTGMQHEASMTGAVVHIVRCNDVQLKAGIARQVYSLCGRIHDKNDSWALCPDAPVTCPKCRKKSDK